MINSRQGNAGAITVVVILGIIIIVGIIYMAMRNDQGEMMEDENEVMMKDDSMMATSSDTGSMMDESTTTAMMDKDAMVKGSYQTYDPAKLQMAENGNVVLFFHADWCPTCRTTNTDINAKLGTIPNDLTILKVDYDNSTDLKRKYGVTSQHTFVQVDAQGNLINKWSGSSTLEDIVEEVR